MSAESSIKSTLDPRPYTLAYNYVVFLVSINLDYIIAACSLCILYHTYHNIVSYTATLEHIYHIGMQMKSAENCFEL